MTVPAVGTHTSEVVALQAYAARPALRVSELNALLVYAPAETKITRISELVGLTVYACGYYAVPEISQFVANVAYGSGIGEPSRTRAWTFVLDGHTFYVLDLGEEGTFLYDISTGQWCEFQTQGHTGWNVRNGTVWGTLGRIAGSDQLNALLWEVDPNVHNDEGFRSIEHVVTGGIATRTRVYKSVNQVRVTGSAGVLDDEAGAQFTMRFSDDGGETWSADYIVDLTADDFTGEMVWRSLGSFMAPGRIFEMSDFGGLLRIDGANISITDFDDGDDPG
jgi:hypothetical protein